MTKMANDVRKISKNTKLVNLQSFKDERGVLSVITEKMIGFCYTRMYFVKNVPIGTVRGSHAHLYTTQFLICLEGECLVKIDNGVSSKNYKLNDSKEGLLVPPMNWGNITYTKAGTVLLVLASHDYDRHDYITDYEEYKNYNKYKEKNNEN